MNANKPNTPNIKNPNIKVLMYHKIVKDEDYSPSQWINISKEQFRKHLSLIDKWGFTPITFRDYLLFTNGKLQLPKKPVILTFDDGYEEVYKIAYPLLKDLGWNAVVFVIADWRITKDLWNNNSGKGNLNLLNSEQIIELCESGFEIGSHSMTHQRLPEEQHDNAWYEIARSKVELEFLTNSTVHSFSYPYGGVNAQLKQMVKEAGYKIGCGVFTGPPKFGKDIFDVRRITVTGNTNTLGFALKMLTPYEYFEYIGSKIIHAKNNRHHENDVEFVTNNQTEIKTTEPHINV